MQYRIEYRGIPVGFRVEGLGFRVEGLGFSEFGVANVAPKLLVHVEGSDSCLATC